VISHARKLVVALVGAGLAAPLALTAAAPAATAATCPAPGGAAAARTAADPVGAEVVFRGQGSGHGLGMSQWGARGAARLGCTANQILATYYPGTQLAARTMPSEVKLWMLLNGTHANVFAENGPVTWKLSGCVVACPPVQPVGATWRVGTDALKTRFELRDTATDAVVWSGGLLGATLTAAHSGTVIKLDSFRGTTSYLSRRLRWDETRYTFDAAGLDAVQAIRNTTAGTAMDKYLRGLSEVSIGWTRDAHEALRSQAIAGRTYAYTKLMAGTVMYATPTHQNYLGYSREAEDAAYKDQYGRNNRWRDAVDSTSGQVVQQADGTVIDTYFSSSFGGYSEDAKYVWGYTSIPYLRAIDDSAWHNASGNTSASWTRGFTRAEVAAKLGFTSVSSITVGAYGSTDRLAGVKVTGIKNGVVTTVKMTGWNVKVKLGLPSTGFTAEMLPVAGTAAA
jgi:stage II sporulation protein D